MPWHEASAQNKPSQSKRGGSYEKESSAQQTQSEENDANRGDERDHKSSLAHHPPSGFERYKKGHSTEQKSRHGSETEVADCDEARRYQGDDDDSDRLYNLLSIEVAPVSA